MSDEYFEFLYEKQSYWALDKTFVDDSLFKDRYGFDLFARSYHSFVDVGANTGLFFLRNCHRIQNCHLIEPDLEAFGLLEKNFESKLGKSVTIQNLGIAEISGHHSIEQLQDQDVTFSKKKLDCETLFIPGDQLRLQPEGMKLDVYQEIFPVLKSFQQTLSRCTPDLYIAKYRGCRYDEIQRYLENFGYTLLYDSDKENVSRGALVFFAK